MENPPSQETNQQFNERVNVVVNGQAHIRQVDPSLSLLSEKQFYKVTGIEASWPARVALLRLLEEDVKTRDVCSIWNRELLFTGNRFRIKINKYPLHLTAVFTAIMAVMSVRLGALLYLLPTPAPQHELFELSSCLVLWVLSFYGFATCINKLYKPRQFAIRLNNIIDLVNDDVPSRIEAARRAFD